MISHEYTREGILRQYPHLSDEDAQRLADNANRGNQLAVPDTGIGSNHPEYHICTSGCPCGAHGFTHNYHPK